MIAILVGSLALSANAGELTLTGTAHIGAPADFIGVTVTVNSKCYGSAEAVRNGNGLLAKKIQKIMNQYKTGQNDELKVTDGFTQRKTETQYDQVTRQNTVLCANAWAKSSQLVLNMAKISDWPALQDKILKAIDSSAGKVLSASKAQTVATLSQPAPALYPETRQQLSDEALQTASIDAQSQLDQLQSICGFKVKAIKGIKDAGQARPIAYSDRNALATPASGTGLTLSFGQQYVHKALSITWEIEGSGPCAIKAPQPQ